MNAELVFFGRRVSMALRSRRRRLVIAIYALLAALMIALWFTTHWRGAGAYLFWAVMLACRLFLGGYYAGGLVKPFNGKALKQSETPPTLLMLKLRLYRPVLAADEHTWRNDERELRQRDRAHYLAYHALGALVIALWFFSSLRVNQSTWLSLNALTADEIYYGCLMTALTLFLTLPQSILLWTEPDMEQES